MALDFLAHFSWGQFAVIALIYTLAPILSSARWGRYREINELMLAVKTSPISAIRIHLVFVSLLLALCWIPAHYCSRLPDGLKQSIWAGVTTLDAVIFALFIVMVVTEEKLIRSSSDAQ